jgi:lysozyme
MAISVLAWCRFWNQGSLRHSSRPAAIVDLTFNLGARRLQTSTLRRRVNQRDWSGAATELRRWVYGAGKVLP